MRTSWSAALGSVVAAALTLAALLAVANPTPVVRAGLTLATPLVAVMAFMGSWQSQACPRCGARRSKQVRTSQAPQVDPGSRAGTRAGKVSVELGWDVVLRHSVSCTACEHRYDTSDSVFVPRSVASTASEAVVLAARNE